PGAEGQRLRGTGHGRQRDDDENAIPSGRRGGGVEFAVPTVLAAASLKPSAGDWRLYPGGGASSRRSPAHSDPRRHSFVLPLPRRQRGAIPPSVGAAEVCGDWSVPASCRVPCSPPSLLPPHAPARQSLNPAR
ncbi:hypothetical protein THAOC_28419, partial [Thalassiosira oceanica]